MNQYHSAVFVIFRDLEWQRTFICAVDELKHSAGWNKDVVEVNHVVLSYLVENRSFNRLKKHFRNLLRSGLAVKAALPDRWHELAE